MDAAQADLSSIREAVVFLAAAALLVPILERLRLGPVLGFLIAGILIGPNGLGALAAHFPPLRFLVISDNAGVRLLAELGVVFLLFVIGLELSFDRLIRMRTLVFGLGGLQVVATGTILALIGWSAMGMSAEAAVVAGLAFALSSTAIVIQLLTDERRMGSRLGQVSFAILLFQDLSVVPILFLVGALSGQAGSSAVLTFALAILKAVAAIAFILLLGRQVIRPLFRFVGAARKPEVFMALSLLVILGTAGATAAAGLSMAVGAFLAGLLLAETEFRHQIDADITPFKGLLLGLFFMSVGMGMDMRTLGLQAPLVLAIVAGVIAVKTVVVAALCRLFRQPRGLAVEAGILLSQVGEFAFVVVAVARQVKLLPDSLANIMLIVTSLTMFVTPLLSGLARRLGKGVFEHDLGGTDADVTGATHLDDHVIIAGYGRVGTVLSTALEREEVGYVALDLDADGVAAARVEGKPVYYGDAARSEVLQRAGIEKARALVITTDDPNSVETIVAEVRNLWPQLPIYARARDIAHARKLVALGATRAVPETLEGSLQLAEELLESAGVPDEAAERICDDLRSAALNEAEKAARVA